MAQERVDNVSAAELEAYLAGVKFPADKDDIVGHMTHEGAPSKILDLINRAPNKTYESIPDLAVGMSLRRDH